MFGIFGPENKRNRLVKSCKAGPLKDFLEYASPDNSQAIDGSSLLAVDFETTGLDHKKDKILSIGYVQINKLQIDLSTASHLLIKQDDLLPESTVVIHKITDDQVNQGMTQEMAINEFLNVLKGKIMIAHHAHIECHFLDQACKQVHGSGVILPVIDTLEIEAKKLPEHQHGNNNLNLNLCCQRYNLPRYRLHDALSDALSCAELLLGQMAYSAQKSVNLGSVMRFLP